MNDVNLYSHPVVRDLDWILTSPALMVDNLHCFSAFQFDQSTIANSIAWLQYLDTHPEKINLDKSQFKRLGHYFEALLAFLFTQGWQDKVMPYRMIARNIQFNSEKATLGELDFLLRDQNSNFIHVECAVKFYLGKIKSERWSNWVGPNAKDRLDIKLNRLLHHQLSILNDKSNDAVNEYFQAKQIDPATVSSKYFLRGIFFYSHSRSKHLPSLANPTALTACWMLASDFLKNYAPALETWTALPKLNWLGGPVQSNSMCNSANSPKTLVPFPNLMCKYTDQQELLMVVPDHWLEVNSPSRKI